MKKIKTAPARAVFISTSYTQKENDGTKPKKARLRELVGVESILVS